MTKVVKKLFFVWNEHGEKLFLEDMAKQGYILTGVKFGKYFFEEAEPADLSYQFDFKGISNMPEDEYISLYKDTGWHLNCQYGGWYYFSRAKENGEDQTLFNDIKSKNSKYRRLLFYLLLVGFPLYYQVMIIFPNMDANEFIFPNFYFFLRIVVVIFSILHFFVLVKVARIFLKSRGEISE